MSSLNCGQCNQPISCPDGDIVNLRKHIKAEHEVVKYKLDLNLAIALLTEDEVEELVKRVKDRLDGFQKTSTLDTSKAIFNHKETSENQNASEDGIEDMDSGGEVVKESPPELVEETPGASGSEDLDDSLVVEDGVEDVVESVNTTKHRH